MKFVDYLATIFKDDDKEHSPFGPSSLEKRSLCPGSANAEDGLKELESSEAAKRGTLLHAAVAGILAGSLNPADLLKGYDEDEDAQAVRTCVSYVQFRRSEMPSARLIIEKTLDCTSIHHLCEKGTPDIAIVASFNRAIVIDNKFGGGFVPPAVENKQMGALAVAVADLYGCSEVEVVLLKAMDGFTSTWTYDADGLEKAREYLCAIIDATQAPFAPCRPSGDACRYCRASGSCAAQAAIASKLPVTVTPSDLAPVELAKVLKQALIVKQMVKAVEQHAYAVLTAGGDIPGYHLKAGRKSYSWAEGVDEKKLKAVAKKLGKPTDKFIETKVKLVSVSKGKTILGTSKAAKGELLSLVEEKPGRLVLAPVKEEGE